MNGVLEKESKARNETKNSYNTSMSNESERGRVRERERENVRERERVKMRDKERDEERNEQIRVEPKETGVRNEKEHEWIMKIIKAYCTEMC